MPYSGPDAELQRRFAPVLDALARQAAVTERLMDKDLYRILVCTLWVNVVLDPPAAGIGESDLEDLHDVVNDHLAAALGPAESLKSCFRYLSGTAGERAMQQARLTPEHRDVLLYFASIIVDPDGHRRWMDEIRNRPSR